MTPTELALAYHSDTKHHLGCYARGPAGLNWATQPSPFRTFAGAPQVKLSLVADALPPTFRDLDHPDVVVARSLSVEAIGAILELSLGLSAWKELNGTRWALRCNPSSGNLHPTEGYAVLPDVLGLPAGVYHYRSEDHLLECRSALRGDPGCALATLLPPGGFVIVLSSIPWREAWKYGERAFRYSQLDIGHAIAAVRYAAAVLGWSAALLDGLGDRDLARLVGLNREEDFPGIDPIERERACAALLVCPGVAAAHTADVLNGALVRVLGGAAWSGRANALSPNHTEWARVTDVAQATEAPSVPLHVQIPSPTLHTVPLAGAAPPSTASSLIRRRRSAVAFDGETSIGDEAFYVMLDHLLPRSLEHRIPPWDVLPWVPRIHAGIFVHRVRGLEPGLYAFERSESVHKRLRAAMHDDFLWARPKSCPEHLRLFLLMDLDLRNAAQTVSCHQDIAADGAFSLGMIADYFEPIHKEGAHVYRRLFWEAGVLGQVLYLEAEAASAPATPIRATGIGCYFDDAFHELCGFKGDAFQSLYHFTVGAPVDDPRLTTLPPYGHLGSRARSCLPPPLQLR